jgi:hypothetical protein
MDLRRFSLTGSGMTGRTGCLMGLVLCLTAPNRISGQCPGPSCQTWAEVRSFGQTGFRTLPTWPEGIPIRADVSSYQPYASYSYGNYNPYSFSRERLSYSYSYDSGSPYSAPGSGYYYPSGNRSRRGLFQR